MPPAPIWELIREGPVQAIHKYTRSTNDGSSSGGIQYGRLHQRRGKIGQTQFGFQSSHPVFQRNPQQSPNSTTFPQSRRGSRLSPLPSCGNLLPHAKTRCLSVVLSPASIEVFWDASSPRLDCALRHQEFGGDGNRSGRNPLLRRAIFTDECASTGCVPTIRSVLPGQRADFTHGRKGTVSCDGERRGSRESPVPERRYGAPGVATASTTSATAAGARNAPHEEAHLV